MVCSVIGGVPVSVNGHVSGVLIPVWVGGGASLQFHLVPLCAFYKLVKPGSQIGAHSPVLTFTGHLASPQPHPSQSFQGNTWYSKYCMCDLVDRMGRGRRGDGLALEIVQSCRNVMPDLIGSREGGFCLLDCLPSFNLVQQTLTKNSFVLVRTG